MNNNKKIIELFEELDGLGMRNELDSDSYAEQYWNIKMHIIEEISSRYDCAYNPESLRALKIPCGIMSMIVEMERERLLL